MIRIDEIYNNTFWPWLKENRPGTRMFFCDPPGHTGPEHLFNLGHDNILETDYVFFHDQEPVDIDLFEPLFKAVQSCNLGIGTRKVSNTGIDLIDWVRDFPTPPGHIVVSERGQGIQDLCSKYGWQSHYYFYHGWACQDWFRGYDKTFLIPRARDRHPSQTFMSPNRIIAGKRDHRVLFLYNVLRQGLSHNHISAPRMCQYENVDISIIAQKYANVYQDIVTVFDQAQLPRLFAGEKTQQMTSCWLGNFAEAQDSLIYVPTETVYFGRRTHITEKTFKAIALEMPFVLVAPAGSLEYMREYGFQTFAGILDESYDEETDDLQRVERVVKLLKDLDDLSVGERQQIHRACLPRVEHNYNHFYRGGFADILWSELINMLNGLRI
jgi:hypothetical protein